MKVTSTQLLVLFAAIDACIAEVSAVAIQVRARQDASEQGQLCLYSLESLRDQLLDSRDDPQFAPRWLLASCTDRANVANAVKQQVLAALRPTGTLKLSAIRARREQRIRRMLGSFPNIRSLARTLTSPKPEVSYLLRARAA